MVTQILTQVFKDMFPSYDIPIPTKLKLLISVTVLITAIFQQLDIVTDFQSRQQNIKKMSFVTMDQPFETMDYKKKRYLTRLRDMTAKNQQVGV